MRSEQNVHGYRKLWLVAYLRWIHVISAFSDILPFFNGGDITNMMEIELGLVCNKIC